MGCLTACPDEETWQLFVSRRLTSTGTLDAHLVECRHCRDLLAILTSELPTSPEALASASRDRVSRSARGSDGSARLGAVIMSKWRVEALLGAGGMGRVYRARHLNGHEVAIKFLHPALASRAEVVRRFRREGYAANRVAHPAVVKVLDDGDDGGPFLVMELLEGRSCRRAIDESGPFSFDAAMKIVSVVGRAVGQAHKVGVVHRDIKPDNIFVTTGGDVRLLDFGLASVRDLSGPDTRTIDGVTIGTVGYMSPEQAKGDNTVVSERSDVWSLAATCISLMTGKTIHGGQTAAEQLAFAVTKHAPPTRSWNLGLPRSVEEVLDRGLSFDPAGRHETADALIDDLERALAAKAHPPRTRRAMLIVTVAASLAVAGIGLAWTTSHVDAAANARVIAPPQASTAQGAEGTKPPPQASTPLPAGPPAVSLAPRSNETPRSVASTSPKAPLRRSSAGHDAVTPQPTNSIAPPSPPPRDPLTPRF